MVDFITPILKGVKQELKQNIDPEYCEGERRFFKEAIKNFGVRLPNRRRVARKFQSLVKKLTKAELFHLTEKMFAAGYNEMATIASVWVYSRGQEYKPKDFKIFQGWVEKYLDNWAKIDDFCTHSLGYLVNQYPQLLSKLFHWTKSKNRWVKRAAAVTLIYPVNQPKDILLVLKIAALLLTDPDDMVQKGYGWMLKEASKHNQKEVFNFVMKHKAKMPRTALRYAIEKLPKILKQKAMVK